LPLIIAVFGIFMMAAGATCSECGCITSCPNKAEIQQHIWMKEAACFLYSDDCCYSTGIAAPFGIGISAKNITSAGNITGGDYLNEADRLYLAGSYEQAAKLYAKAVEIDSSLLSGWLNMGNALFFMKRYEESLNAYDSLLNLDPQNENALLGKREALSALNRADGASAVNGGVEMLQNRKIMELGGLSSTAGAITPLIVGSY
jgi:tetratricopeptide (TPR) repeat protein